ncbi:MAG: carboxypeptidase regulatory-like domain-containing protein [Candidatus Hydrogenedentes bacterium]|nr:carboxypeptidase regulatory-like domain-containing protein [Candidatus Hydrogenedentota bacterium]
MRPRILLAILLCAAMTLTGCGRVALQGRVTTIQGEALPGVAVYESKVDDGRLTNARGGYRLLRRPGPVLLRFSKTGYSPAELRLNVKPGKTVPVPTVRMWQLPERAGVYILDESGYTETTWVNPKNFFMAEGGMAYATRREPAATAVGTAPQIICYKTPRYNARLSRLRRAEAKLGAGDTQTFEVWTAGGTIPVDLVPVDEPEGMLLRLRTEHALDPGVYAVHWGALDGYTTLESRAFMLTIAEEAIAPVVPIHEPAPEESADRSALGADSEMPLETETDATDTEVAIPPNPDTANPAPETETQPDPIE